MVFPTRICPANFPPISVMSLVLSCRIFNVVFFFPRTFFSRRVWLELFYWAASRHVPFIYRRLRMCRETGPSPSHCSLGAGWDTAGGWGEGGFGQHLTGKGLVTVCDGTRDAVKFQETGRIGGHSCMGDLGRPPVDQGIRGLAGSWCSASRRLSE